MTWKECKLIALQTMFSNEGTVLTVDDGNQEYINAMPGKANEAMHQLALVGRPIKKSFRLTLAADAEEDHQSGVFLTLPVSEGRYKITLTDYCPRFRCVEQLMLDAGGVYGEADDWTLEGDDVLVVPGSAGEYTLWYAAYPQTITQETPDEEELDLPQEAAALVPLYIAAELYKEDELAMATMFRNEFEDGLGKMRQAYMESGSGVRGGKIRNTTGWW
ncbi:MAG: hypothetical protein MJ074_06715 [Oscillospiraceae bacterium]|nr:hypothetical protein [Oscillospiraceae bacterium]